MKKAATKGPKDGRFAASAGDRRSPPNGPPRLDPTSSVAIAATAYAPAKINLRLRVVGRRPDGYHLLDSLLLPVGVFDCLVVRVWPAAHPTVELCCQSPGVPRGGDNLAVRAAHLFMRETMTTLKVVVELKKEIPVGAGLGGGSSDAAAVLRALNAIVGTDIPQEQLMEWALSLGADVPFFIYGRPARIRGIGEWVEGLHDWPSGPLVLAFCGASLATSEVYAAYDDLLTSRGAASSIRRPTRGQMPLRDLLVNDLEAAAIRIQPGLRGLKTRLLRLGAQGALMTGSGSSVFGFWEKWDEARAAAERLRRQGVWARAVGVLARAPGLTIR